MRNASLRFVCKQVNLRVENARTPYTTRLQEGQVVRIPVSHGEGNYFASDDALDRLEGEGRVVFRYCDASGALAPGANPNGSARHIAGIVNEGRNVLGMMPHPDRCAEGVLGSADGKPLFESIIDHIAQA